MSSLAAAPLFAVLTMVSLAPLLVYFRAFSTAANARPQ
jgi:hypothetical protein